MWPQGGPLSLRAIDAYPQGNVAPQGLSIPYYVPLDGSQLSIGPFPFRPRSLTIINQTGGVITVTDDRGEAYVANSSTAATFGTGDTMRLTAAVSPAQPAGKATIVVSDVPQAVASAQLASLAPAGAQIRRVAAIPSSPSDGDVIAWSPDPTNFPGVEWLLIFNAATTYWDSLGGNTPLVVQSIGSASNGGTINTWLNMVAQVLVIPRVGDYYLTGGGLATAGASAMSLISALYLNTAANIFNFNTRNDLPAANNSGPFMFPRQRDSLLAGAQIGIAGQANVINAGWSQMTFEVQPIRIK